MPFQSRVALFDGARIKATDVFPPTIELDLYVCEQCGKAELYR
jgi:hypothetical protein